MAVIYNKIAIIGMGLIGASIARASRRAGLATVMAGYDADPAAMADVAALQLVDEVADSAAAAVADADFGDYGGTGWRRGGGCRDHCATYETGGGVNRYWVNKTVGVA